MSGTKGMRAARRGSRSEAGVVEPEAAAKEEEEEEEGPDAEAEGGPVRVAAGVGGRLTVEGARGESVGVGAALAAAWAV